MTNKYFGPNKHKYMTNKGRIFSNYIFSVLHDDALDKYDIAIELGAGMGRFSYPIVSKYSKIFLVEPEENYVNILKDTFIQDNVRIIQSTAEEFLKSYEEKKPALIFCFHLMHHLFIEQRKIIYQFVRRTNSKIIFVEPNPYNPLVLIQIICHPDMSIREEIQYLTQTYRKLRKEITNNGLSVTSFKRFCFLPPYLMNFFLTRWTVKSISNLEIISKILPFIGSYQMMICGGDRNG